MGILLDALYPFDKPTTCNDPKIVQVYNEMVERAWHRQFEEGGDSENDGKPTLYRPSGMGKAAIDILLSKCLPYPKGVTDPRFRDLFFQGDMFEANYVRHLFRTGVIDPHCFNEGEHYQVYVKYSIEDCPDAIEGHTDLLIDNGGIRTLIELKSTNSGYFNSMEKRFSDFRGHITQASLYTVATGADAGVLILYCKENSKMLYHVLTDKDIETSMSRVHGIMRGWSKIEEWYEAFVYGGIPEPRKELRNRSHTGRYLVPPKLYGCPYIPLMYDWVTDDGRVIIEGYAVPKVSLDLIPEKLLDIYNEIGITTYETSAEDRLYEYQNATK